VLPAGARRLRVADPELAATLRFAGAELVTNRPDVEIAPLPELQGDAQATLVPHDAGVHAVYEGAPAPIRAARRVYRSRGVRAQARRALRVLRGRYPRTAIVLWDLEGTARRPDESAHPSSPTDRFPLGAVAVGSRSDEPTLLAAVAEAAGFAGAYPVALVRESGLVLTGEPGVLRVSVGPARHHVDVQRSVLEALRDAEPPPSVAERIPWLRAAGETGLAVWSLERRLPGSTTPPRRPTAFVQDCLDFLVALFAATRDGAPASAEENAAAIADALGPDDAHALVPLGRRLDADLADLPRGLAHGDFAVGNLLLTGGRLSGVIDWERAGTGRLPLVDLFNFVLHEYWARAGGSLGAALVEWLVPWVRAGADERVRSYCDRLGLRLDGARLADVALAYWLERYAFQLAMYADRPQRRVWLEQNVLVVLRALSDGGAPTRARPAGRAGPSRRPSS
jgi:aminoglycoside phosphotransferase (APT) family kinase protein